MDFSYFKTLLFPLILILAFSLCKPKFQEKTQILTAIDHIDPLIGTAVASTPSAIKHSVSGSELRGQTYPAVGVPHGMTQWAPQTHATEK